MSDSKKYVVLSVPLRPKQIQPGDDEYTDRALEDFEEEIEAQLNDVVSSGWAVMGLHPFGDRGVIILCDTEPAPATAVVQIPLSTMRREAPPPTLLPAVIEILSTYMDRLNNQHMRHDHPKAEEELLAITERVTRQASGSVLSEYVANIEAVSSHHKEHCRDEGCSETYILGLAAKVLRTLLQRRTQ